MLNELIFFLSIAFVSSASLVALALGREALVAFICLQVVLVNIFVTKQILLFGFTATASDALAVGATLGLNLLQEYYGKPTARKAIWTSFFCSLFYVLISILHLSFLPAPTDTSSPAFNFLFTPMPRIIAASLVVYIFVQYLDSTLYGFLRHQFAGRHFILRNYSSLILTQFLDTLLFSFLGLYSINESFASMGTLFDIIFISFMIKLLVICIAVPFVRATKILFDLQPVAP